MTKITPPEEYVDKTHGTDLHPDTRRILAYLAPMPAWVTTALHNLIDRGIVGVPLDQAQEMWREELAAAKAAAPKVTEH